MKDFRVVRARTLLKLNSLLPIRGFQPPSILVTGESLDQTEEVLYNGMTANEFSVAGADRLIIRIPPSQIGKDLLNLKVFSSSSLGEGGSILKLSLHPPVKMVSGVDRMVQAWLLEFMTTPGSDIFSPDSGGGGRSLVGRNTDGTGKGIAADLSLAVERTKNRLMKLQAGQPRLPPSERLLSCTLSDVQFDPSSTTLSAVISLYNMLGDGADVSLSR